VSEHKAELASAATTLEELLARVTAAADAYGSGTDESIAAELYDVERSLRPAVRSLNPLVDRL
jgi:hypothetical protein